MAPILPPPEPAGFGACAQCAYRTTGTAETCFKCASRRLTDIDAAKNCQICDGTVGPSGECGNPLCNRPSAERGWDYIYAIAMRSGELERTISRYKYQDRHGWGRIFARIVVGYLNDREQIFNDYDLIIPSPTFVGEGGRSRDHIGFILEWAKQEDPHWPIRLDVMVKTQPTPRLKDQPSWRARAIVAEDEIGPSLEVLDPSAIDGRSILVFDDVFTGGLTLREIASKLRDAGAHHVAGLVLARQPFRG